jgi:tetratricopeptide (TPR) repeat protein
LLEQVPDAPVSDSFVVPPGYYCAIDAIYKLPHPKDTSLRKIISNELSKVGGKFPEDLHFSQSKLSAEEKTVLLGNLSEEIKAWAGDQRMLHGVYIKHQQDIFKNASDILTEKAFDNRYLSMLWSLVEHLVFVDEKIRERLTDDATVHLHVASRIFVFDSKSLKEKQDELKALGYHLIQAKWDPESHYTFTLDERELTTMVRMALRHRWNRVGTRFGSIACSSIQYKQERYNQLKPPMALYLADLFLGQSRTLYYPEERGRLKQRLFSPPFRVLNYGPWLEKLAQMRASLGAGDIDSFLMAAQAYYTFDRQIRSHFHPIANRASNKASRLLGENKEKLKSFLQELGRQVDRPGKAATLCEFVGWSGKLIEKAAVDDRLLRAMHLQSRLSICNHTGDVAGADRVWEKYLEVEPELYTSGAEGLQIKSEMRNRRAVSLTDAFHYREAENILLELISLQQDALQHVATAFGIDVKDIPSRELGACYGTLGQIYAFTGTNESTSFAEMSFRQALTLFKDEVDIRRQWVYLGHLACDRRTAGTDLWREVLTHLPDLGSETPVSECGKQFELVLQIKGLIVFGSTESRVEFCKRLESTPIGGSIPKSELRSHPYGLVYQNLAMLYQRLWHENRQNTDYQKSAAAYFEGASKVMKGEKGLLQALGTAAQLRKALFSATGGAGDESVARGFNTFRESLINQFSDRVWWENENGKSGGHFGRLDPGPEYSWAERSAAVLNGLRFNYW